MKKVILNRQEFIIARENLQNQTRLLSYRENSSEYYYQMLRDQGKYMDKLEEAEKKYLNGDKSAIKAYADDYDTFVNIKAQALKDAQKIDDTYVKTLREEAELTNSIILNGVRPSWAKLRLELEQARKAEEDLRKEGKLNGESQDEYTARVNAAATKTNELVVALRQAARDSMVLKEETKHAQQVFEKWNDTKSHWNPFANINGGIMGEMNKLPDLINTEFKNSVDDALSTLDAGAVAKNLQIFLDNVYAESGEEAGDATKEYWLKKLGIWDLDALTNDKLKDVTDKFKNLDITSVTQSTLTELDRLIEAGVVPEDILTNYLDSLNKLKDAEENLLQQRWNNWQTLGDNIGSVFSSIGDIYAQALENRKAELEENGKFDEEAQKQLEEQYKRVQAVKIAQATINTIQGALAAFMGCQELGQPWGLALGIAQAAAVTAAGVAQIQQIASTNPYSNATPSSPDVASATPTLNEYQPVLASNITGQNETATLANAMSKIQPVVRVTDIEDTERLTYVRVEEATF